MDYIPSKYLYYNAVYCIYNYFRDGRASNWKEAANLYEEECHRNRMEDLASMQAQASINAEIYAKAAANSVNNLNSQMRNLNSQVGSLKLKVQIISPIPSAWDYKFSELNQGRKVTVALSDGTFIRGAYYSKSMASSDDGYRDIYLEETWQLDEQDRWVKVDATDGVWISPNVIKWISFMEDANDVGE